MILCKIQNSNLGIPLPHTESDLIQKKEEKGGKLTGVLSRLTVETLHLDWFSENTGVTLVEQEGGPRSVVRKCRTRSRTRDPALGTLHSASRLSTWRPDYHIRSQRARAAT